jgi:amino acid adenylation domain-containing protein
VLAGWQALLGRYSGQADLNVGTPIAGRNRLELEGLIGLFVNTLVLRGDLSGDPSVGELLGRVKEVVLEAHAHQDLPFEKLVEELQPERSLAHSPLFQVMLVLQSAARSEAVDPAFLRTSRLGVEAESAKFDLTLGVEERRGAGLSLALSYRTDLFDAPTAKRMLRHLEVLLGGVAADRERRLSALPLLSEAERAQLLVEWNEAGAPVGISERCLHERFAEQAARSPGAVALIDGERETSYGELDRQSSRLAHHLRSLGAGPEVPVALCLERGAGMVVAILGVLKAGAAYVPLDPAYPPERLHLMLEDSAAPVVVTESALAGALPEHPARRVLLDADREMLDGQSAASLAAGACPDNLAYVIYTSGSTGRPKGVAITHRSAAVLLGWAEEVYGAQQIAGVLAATSICFDLSIFELFVPLTRGGAVVLAAHALALPGLPGASRVTLVNTVPSVMAELVRSAGLPASVRTVNLAGEALPPLLVEQVYAVGTVREVYNLYGPSEDTTYSTWALMAREPGAACTIGRPISGTRACLLDAHLNPVPVGAAGELSLGGEGLARGYLRRPDLTAERFVPDPFGEPGARRYRTGDLARQRPDGRIDFLGRIDHQVKIRGFRIEPGEIEAALRSHAEVDQAVVLTREDRPGDRRLVAYVVARGRGSLGETEMKAHLRRTLPEHMVPSHLLCLAALPLTPNGKVDRRALPEPERRTAAGADLAPRDGIEHDLQKIWEEVLGVPVGMADNFFDLGGHSLLAIKLITRIRRQFGGALPVAALFETGTIESLAPQLRRAGPLRSSPLVRIHAGTGPETLFFVHPGGGGVFGYAPLARRLDARRFYGFQAPGLEGEREPLGSVEELAELYLAAVGSVRPAGPCLLGGWSMGGLVALEMARRLEDEGRSVDLVVLLDTRVPAAVSPQPDDDLRFLAAFAAEIGLPADHLRLSPEELSRLDPELRLAWILERAHAERVLPPDMDTRLLERRLAVFRSNVQAMRSYSVRSYGGEVVLFAAEDAPPEAAEAWRPAIPRLQVEASKGTHFTLVHEPHVNLLAERLQAHLRRISESENAS